MALRWHDVMFLTGGEIWKRYGVPLLKTRGAEIGGEALKETHTRASSATFLDASGILRTAGNDVLRNDWDLTTDTAGLLLEAAGSNEALHSEAFDNAVWQGTAQVVPNSGAVPDPAGGTTSDLLTDSSAVASERKYQDVTVPDDTTTWTVSVYLAKQAAGTPVTIIALAFTGGTTAEGRIAVDPATGGMTLGQAVVQGRAVDISSAWWRVDLSVANTGAGNTTARSSIYPAGRTDLASTDLVDATQGTNRFWGAQLENRAGASSYTPTTTGTVARSGDLLTFPWYHAPQPGAFYLDITMVGGVAGRVLQIGNAADQDPRLIVNTDGAGLWRMDYRPNGQLFTSQITLGTGAAGERVELLPVLTRGGAAVLSGRLNGGTTVTGTPSADGGFPAAWAAPTVLAVNSEPDGSTACAGWYGLVGAAMDQSATLGDFAGLLR